ncbi:hypothetical protein QVD17_10968 [Tagetes erecta]|uniref:Uncharacterized protein n=1 Tax=Tagetes erecta TaxID=13708 RepID=A0AAD8LAD9_TARER|nr:hypothetical protein QVD17_10968 [Tagetes erecta]
MRSVFLPKIHASIKQNAYPNYSVHWMQLQKNLRSKERIRGTENHCIRFTTLFERCKQYTFGVERRNIIVFCRVQPLLYVEHPASAKVTVSYPSSVESAGQGIDLYQKGQKH